MMTVIAARVGDDLVLATRADTLLISDSPRGLLFARLLVNGEQTPAHVETPDGRRWLLVPQTARVDRALRGLRFALDHLIYLDERDAALTPNPSSVAVTPADSVRGQAGEGSSDVRGHAPPPDPDAELAVRLAEAWRAGASKNALARMAGFPQYGGSYVARIDRAIEWLERNATTMPRADADLPVSDSPGLPGAGVVVE